MIPPLDLEHAKLELERLVKESAPELKIKSISISIDSDFDGAEIIRVRIVHYGRKADAKTFSDQRFRISDGFRTWLMKSGEDRFPHFTYRSENDDKVEQESKKLDPTP